MNTPMVNPEQPLEILRTLHSFDPCLACSTHVMSAGRPGNEPRHGAVNPHTHEETTHATRKTSVAPPLSRCWPRPAPPRPTGGHGPTPELCGHAHPPSASSSCSCWSGSALGRGGAAPLACSARAQQQTDVTAVPPTEATMSTTSRTTDRRHRHRRERRLARPDHQVGLCVRSTGAPLALDQRGVHHRAGAHRLLHRQPAADHARRGQRALPHGLHPLRALHGGLRAGRGPDRPRLLGAGRQPPRARDVLGADLPEGLLERGAHHAQVVRLPDPAAGPLRGPQPAGAFCDVLGLPDAHDLHDRHRFCAVWRRLADGLVAGAAVRLGDPADGPEPGRAHLAPPGHVGADHLHHAARVRRDPRGHHGPPDHRVHHDFWPPDFKD